MTAADWIEFAGATFACIAVSNVAWTLVLRGRPTPAVELAALTVVMLIFAIGTLVGAVNNTSDSDAANILEAIGLGGWAFAALAYSGHRSLAQRGQSMEPRLWLAAFAALVLLAVAVGLPNPEFGQSGLAIANGVVYAVGFFTFSLTLTNARHGGLLRSKASGTAAAGLGLLTIFGIALAIVGAFVYGNHPTLNWVRWGLSIAAFLAAIGFTVLAAAAFRCLREQTPPSVPNMCPRCGQPIGAEQQFCSRCGAQVAFPPGYYPDPASGMMRWWDGHNWTEHTSPPPTAVS